ncbi:transporter substrate-binding domain-containing protein [Pseudomonas sp. TH34]|uniref:Transporter substrate-binding domain-containing protein n=1 Tax=Pseudomonas yamanorum TaxID=515393 RepID=A0AAJ3H691_9PSED|nr:MULTISPECIES: transporter substrate-binding domain-containing protein [Pseudomonas]AMW84240.1 Lysine-arginine-ornithine-binding periplasmic protein precursor [Pseudomonas yamanorum]MBK5410477.1 transporter substrate-binding domain-containing protein [Pseudomonas sp. TH34]MBV6661417.1 transporter substrate-binding domain-containing protein [Pseudomonas yamanorum]NVZ92475.1 transporter substrate-binding domain-containing protein [Pseudomonas yamanorum]NWD43864.1 transporter substrate-binding 
MISLTRFVAAAAVATALTGTAWAGSTLDRIHETKVLKVATSANWPPQSFLGPDNQLQGFDIDVASEIGKRLGSKVDFVTPEYGIITAGRWSNRWDLSVGSMTPTTERTRVLDFPAIYYYTPYVFAVHKDAAGTKLADLNGKIIGVEAGTTSEDYINRRLKIDAADVPPFTYDVTPGEVRTYGDSMGPLDDLRMGNGVRLDATLSALPTIVAAIKNGYPVVKVEGKPAYYEPLAIAVDKGDEAFNNALTKIVTDMKADGTLKQLSEKWYGADLTQVQ